MSDRNQNESISHALLALGIVLLLISSIIIAWIIVCCERCRRKRKYRPGQQSLRPDPVGSGAGSITRSGPSPSITRHLLVPKASQHLVIANKAFLSKSTPHLIGMEEELLQDGGAGYGQEENSWRLEGMATPTPSEPLFSSPYKVKGHMHTSPNPAASSRPRPRPTNLNYQSDSVQGPHPQQAVPRSRSEPLLPQLQPGTSANSNTEGGDDQGSVQELSIHDQILAILGTFPSLGFDFFIPTKSSTPLRNNDADFEAAAAADQAEQLQEVKIVSNKQTKPTLYDMDFEYGKESSVDGDILLGVEVDNDVKVTKKTPLLLPTITLNGNGLVSPTKKIKPLPNPRPKTLKFLEKKRYDFVDVQVTVETEVGNDHWDEKLEKDAKDLPPLLETTL